MQNKQLSAKGRMIKARLFFVALSLLCPLASSVSTQDRIRPEELVTRHLESIGTREARATVNTVLTVGTSVVSFRSPAGGQRSGRAVMASSGDRTLIGMNFHNTVYPQENVGYDGRILTTSFIRPGARSALADFLLTHDVIFKQGLFGGTLSTAWPLLNLAARNARLEMAGTDQIDDRTVLGVRYTPRGGSDLQIRLFFDRDTYRHVRTEYRRVISPRMGINIQSSSQQRETRYTMIEDFSDFRQAGSLTLPHTYKLRLTLDTQTGTYATEWTLNLTQFSFNQEINPQSFNVAGNN